MVAKQRNPTSKITSSTSAKGLKSRPDDPEPDFRAAPENGLNSDIAYCPKGTRRATSGCLVVLPWLQWGV
jgi:hypothetical protein